MNDVDTCDLPDPDDANVKCQLPKDGHEVHFHDGPDGRTYWRIPECPEGEECDSNEYN